MFSDTNTLHVDRYPFPLSLSQSLYHSLSHSFLHSLSFSLSRSIYVYMYISLYRSASQPSFRLFILHLFHASRISTLCFVVSLMWPRVYNQGPRALPSLSFPTTRKERPPPCPRSSPSASHGFFSASLLVSLRASSFYHNRRSVSKSGTIYKAEHSSI